MPDKPTYEDLEKERDDLRAKLEAQTQSYREARSMWPEGDTYEATARAIRHEWNRATTYRNRALALMQSLRCWREDYSEAESFGNAMVERLDAAEAARGATEELVNRLVVALKRCRGKAIAIDEVVGTALRISE